jgi:hypothetical protein
MSASYVQSENIVEMIIHGEKSCHGFGFITQTAGRTRQCAEIFAYTSFINDVRSGVFIRRAAGVSKLSVIACEFIHEL